MNAQEFREALELVPSSAEELGVREEEKKQMEEGIIPVPDTIVRLLDVRRQLLELQKKRDVGQVVNMLVRDRVKHYEKVLKGYPDGEELAKRIAQLSEQLKAMTHREGLARGRLTKAETRYRNLKEKRGLPSDNKTKEPEEPETDKLLLALEKKREEAAEKLGEAKIGNRTETVLREMLKDYSSLIAKRRAELGKAQADEQQASAKKKVSTKKQETKKKVFTPLI